MMRKLSLFLILFLLSILPLASEGTAGSSYSTAVGTDAQINTKLTAGTATGTFVGFSSTSHSDDKGLTPITVLNLKLNPDPPTTEINTMTASGSFYAYWIVRNNTTAMKISLSWAVPAGLSITVKKGSDVIESGTSTEIATVPVASTSSSVTTGSQEISVETGDLLDKTYGASYTIVFTIKVEVDQS